jgi:signal transduction histidine kinase/ActR/RegA family two-component response regulator
MPNKRRLKGFALLASICLFYWVLDSIWSYYSFETNLKSMIFFEPGSILDPLLLMVPPYQLVSRLMVTGLFIIFGIIILEFIVKLQAVKEERQKAHDTLLTVLNSIDATIYVADMNTYEIIFMNQNMIDQFGGDFTGKLCHEAFRKNAEICDHCCNDQLLDKEGNPKGMVVWEGQNPITKTWYLNYDRAIRWVDDRIVHLQIATDINRLKELQASQQNAEAQLRQAQKMESIGRLAGGIAHDFNNILAAITGYTELALDDARSGKTAPEELTLVLATAQKAELLIQQILAFSRKAEIRQKPLNLNKVITNAMQIIERTIPRMISVELHLDDNLRLINGDANQLEQVILNLATNATDAMPDGGRLVIETENAALDAEYTARHLGASPGNYVQVVVSDTGHGIKKDELNRIFEPFFTTKEAGKGTGLGLASVYGTVKSHSGYITCYSEEGKGTSFKLFLPVVEDQPVSQDLQINYDPVKMQGQEHILLVDDEESLRDIGSRILDANGYTVTTATSGEDALERYRTSSQPIDLIIMDLSMPGMGGDKAIKELLMDDAGIKIIIASGYTADGQLKDSLEAGAAGYISKPFRAAVLLKTVRTVLDGDAPQ